MFQRKRLVTQLVIVADSVICPQKGYRVAENVVVMDVCVCDRMYVYVSKERQSMPVKARPGEPKAKAQVKGAVFIAATLPYHPSALSASASFFLEKKETWLFTAQIANPASARRRKRTMMIIAMVMLR